VEAAISSGLAQTTTHSSARTALGQPDDGVPFFDIHPPAFGGVRAAAENSDVRGCRHFQRRHRINTARACKARN